MSCETEGAKQTFLVSAGDSGEIVCHEIFVFDSSIVLILAGWCFWSLSFQHRNHLIFEYSIFLGWADSVQIAFFGGYLIKFVGFKE